MAGIEAAPRQSATFGDRSKVCGVIEFRETMHNARVNQGQTFQTVTALLLSVP
jgi:hypothetical protein